MKLITYIQDIQAYGERCRLVILGDTVYIAISRVRKRLLIDITINH